MPTVTSATARTTGGGGTTTSGSITVAAGDLLVACVGSDTPNTTTVTHTVTDSGSGTWTEREHADNATVAGRSGAASVWTRTPAAGTITVTAAGGPDQISLQVYKVTGQAGSPIGAGNVGGSTTASSNPTVFTSTGANRAMLVSANDWNQTGVPTSSDLTITTYNVATFISGFSGFKALGATGAQTAQFTFPAAPDCVWAALEILDGGGSSTDPTTSGGLVSRAASRLTVVPSRTPWQQGDRRDANATASAIPPLDVPLFRLAATQQWARSTWGDRQYRQIVDQSAQAAVAVPGPVTASAWRREYRPPPPVFLPDVDLSTALLEVPGGPAVPWRRDARPMAPGRPPAVDLTTALLEVPGPTPVPTWTRPVARAVPPGPGVDQSTQPAPFDPTLGGLPDAVTSPWRRPGSQPTTPKIPAPIDKVTVVGTGALGAWWSADDDQAHLAANRHVLADQSTPAGTAFDPTLGGLLPWVEQPWRRDALAVRPIRPVAPVPGLQVYGTGQVVPWWSDDDDRAHQAANVRTRLDQSTAGVNFDPTLSGLPDALTSPWRRDPRPAAAVLPVAAIDNVMIVGTGQTSGWWGEDVMPAYLVNELQRYSDPSLLAQVGTPFDPTTGGLPGWLQPAARHDVRWRRDIAVLVDSSSPIGAADPTLLAYLYARVAATWPVDRREYPHQQLLISDPSFYPQVAPTDPLTLAWGVGGVLWTIANQAALQVSRREVPWQKALVSDPSVLATALLEGPLLLTPDAWWRRDARPPAPGAPPTDPSVLSPSAGIDVPLLVAPAGWWRRDTRISPSQPVATDPSVLGGASLDVPLLVPPGTWWRRGPWPIPAPSVLAGQAQPLPPFDPTLRGPGPNLQAATHASRRLIPVQLLHVSAPGLFGALPLGAVFAFLETPDHWLYREARAWMFDDLGDTWTYREAQ